MFDRIKKIIDEHGVENVRFIIPMQRIQGIVMMPGIGITDSSSPEARKICKIDERRYRIADNYKIELHAVDDQDPNDYYGSKSFYLSDLDRSMEHAPEEFVIFVPMTHEKFVQVMKDWEQTRPSEMRLGQALVNAMAPAIVDPEVFYENDARKAVELFCERYLDRVETPPQQTEELPS